MSFRERDICAPKWPRGDQHSDAELGTLAELHCARGARVREYEVLAVVETDKVSVDIKAPADGVVLQVYVAEGEVVMERQPVFRLREEAEPGADEQAAGREWARRYAKRREDEVCTRLLLSSPLLSPLLSYLCIV